MTKQNTSIESGGATTLGRADDMPLSASIEVNVPPVNRDEHPLLRAVLRRKG